MADKIYLGKKSKTFDTSPQFEPYDMVIINLDDEHFVSSPRVTVNEATWISKGYSNGLYEIFYNGSAWKWKNNPSSTANLQSLGINVTYSSVTSAKENDIITVEQTSEEVDGVTEHHVSASISRTGSVLEMDNPFGTIQIADDLLLKVYGFRYQPYNAGSAFLNPAAELGDAITAYGVYGGLYSQDLTFGRLMASNIGAPANEELDEEYEYIPATERKYKRKFAQVESEFIIQASQIAAKVSKTGGTEESFSWELESDHFVIKASGTPMLYIDKDGSQFAGVVKANSIQAGNITIGGQTVYAGYIQGSQIGTNTISGGSGGNIGNATVSGWNVSNSTISAVELTGGVNSDISLGVSAYNSVAYGFGTISTNDLYVTNEQGLSVNMTKAYWCYSNGMYYLGHY